MTTSSRMVAFFRKNDPKTLRGVYGLVLGMRKGGQKTIIIITDLESLCYKYMTHIFLHFAKLFHLNPSARRGSGGID